MRARILVVPYDSGRRDWRMGSGPLRLAGPTAERLRQRGHEVEVHLVEANEPLLESRTAFELCRKIADETRAARAGGELPVVLAGNCAATVGVLAGLDARRPCVVWLDAHGDFNTPETSPSGYLDGMALAIAAGRCWTTVTASIAGHQAIAEEHILLVGARDLDPGERAALERSSVTRLSVADVRAGRLGAALAAVAARTECVVLHVDADVHDPVLTPANTYPAPDGLLAGEVQEIVRQVAGRGQLAGVTIAAYDPGVDPSRSTFAALVDLVATVVARAAATQ